MNDIYFMQIAISEAKISEKLGEFPVGAVIVNPQGMVIAQGHNLRTTTNDATAHAEIVTIRKACEKLSTYRLDNCSIYVTLEPCIMCLGAILSSRISNIIYSVPYTGACSLPLNDVNLYPIPNIRSGILKNECSVFWEVFLKKRLSKLNSIQQPLPVEKNSNSGI